MAMILSNLNRIFKVFSLQDSLVNLQLRGLHMLPLCLVKHYCQKTSELTC